MANKPGVSSKGSPKGKTSGAFKRAHGQNEAQADSHKPANVDDLFSRYLMTKKDTQGKTGFSDVASLAGNSVVMKGIMLDRFNRAQTLALIADTKDFLSSPFGKATGNAVKSGGSMAGRMAKAGASKLWGLTRR